MDLTEYTGYTGIVIQLDDPSKERMMKWATTQKPATLADTPF
jgi:hypothetical protein